MPASDSIAHDIAAEVHAFCAANGDPAVVRKYARFFKEGFEAYGVTDKHPEWASRKQGWIERLRSAGGSAWLDTATLLVENGKFEETMLGVAFAAAMPERYTARAFAKIGKWFDGSISNWAQTDVLCSQVLAVFLANGVVEVGALTAWRDSRFKYKRRAVPVALIPLLKDRAVRPLLAEVEPLVHDSERVVHQGVGWFLREAWKRDHAPVEKLLFRYKDSAPRLMVQYATEKMTATERQRFRRAKAAASSAG